MKIRPEVEVFPDAEYCDGPFLGCHYLKSPECHDDVYSCQLFKDDLENDPLRVIKCDQCKADYLKAKRDEPIDYIDINGYKFDTIKRPVYGACGNRIATILVCDDADRLKFAEMFQTPIDVPVSTHEGLFKHIGGVFATEMHPGSNGNWNISIMIEITNSESI